MPLLIGIAGGSGCGKTTLARELAERMGPGVAVLSTDNYYRTLGEAEHLRALEGGVNFDRPEALDLGRLAEDLRRAREDRDWPLLLPLYDFASHRRAEAKVPLERPRALIVEGIFVLAAAELRELFDVRLFVREDLDQCLARRLRRDTAERGVTLAAALAQYERYVRPAYDEFVGPSAAYADLLIPKPIQNRRAVELVAAWMANRTAVAAGACTAGGGACAVA